MIPRTEMTSSVTHPFKSSLGATAATLFLFLFLFSNGSNGGSSAAVNDHFANRTELSGTDILITASYSGASLEPGEPHQYSASIWWQWTAPFSGGFALQIIGSPHPVVALVYEGVWPNLALVSLPRSDNSLDGPSSVSFRAVAGNTYYFCAADPPLGVIFNVQLGLRPTAGNDDFAKAAAVFGTVNSSPALMLGATVEPGEQVSHSNVVGTLWWKWSPRTNGQFILTASNPGIPVRLVLYQGDSLTNLTRLDIASHDIALEASRLRLDISDGTNSTYYVAIEDAGSLMGTVTLSVRPTSPNDDFAARTILGDAVNLEHFDSFVGATREPGEPGNTNVSVWFEWTAPTNSTFAIQVTSFAASLEVFTGSALTNLVQVSPPFNQLPRAYLGVRAQAGQSYLIRLSTHYWKSGDFSLRIFRGPPNDDFENATRLIGDSITSDATLVAATPQTGEPIIDTGSTGASIWWDWSPTVPGAYLIEAFCRSSMALAAYRGDAFSNLSLIDSGFVSNGIDPARVAVRAAAGEIIRLQATDWQGPGGELSIVIQPGPSNDDFSQALVLTNIFVEGTARGAAVEPGEPLGDSLRHTVWYRWIPPFTGGYDFILTETLASDSLSIYTGDSLETLERLQTFSVFAPERATSAIVADASSDYFISFNSTAEGGGPFEFQIAPGATNDSFAAAELIPRVNFGITAYFLGATREINEPTHSSSNSTRTLWWEWIAPESGTFAVDTIAGHPAPGFAVYQGTDITNLTLVPSPAYRTGHTAFRAVGGEKYWIVAYGETAVGFSFQIMNGPRHDDFENAQELQLGTVVELSGSGATLQSGEPPAPAVASVWHRFTAPSNGTYVVSSPWVSVYRGTSLTNLVPADYERAHFPSFRSVFRAEAGETVFIAVDTFTATYTIIVEPGAVNDDFAARIPIVDASSIPLPSWSTLEPGEPDLGTNVLGGSIWWKWVPAESGLYRFQTPMLPGARLEIYGGSIPLAISNLTLLSITDSPADAILDFTATAGVEYAIRYLTGSYHELELALEVQRPSLNDTLAGAYPLILGETLSTNLLVATLDPGETWTTKGTFWFSWLAPTNGTYVFRAPLRFGRVRSDVGVFLGDSTANLQPIAVFLTYGAYDPAVAFRAVAGSNYWLALATPPLSYPHLVDAAVVPGNPHDDLSAAFPLSGAFAAWTNTTYGTTSEPGEASLSNSTKNASVWADWIAPDSGRYKIVANQMEISVYRGDSISQLQQISPPISAAAEFDAISGVTYHIRIASTPENRREFILRLGPNAPNDEPAGASELSGTNIVASASNWTTPNTFGETPNALWWKWTAPSFGTVSSWISTNVSQSQLSVFHTRTPTLESNVFAPYYLDPARTRSLTNILAVTPGVTYLFAAGSTPATNLTFNLCFQEQPIALGSFTNALLGGDEFWKSQTNNVYSGPDALQAGPLVSKELAWIEMIFPGPGTLSFRTKMSNTPFDLITVNVSNPYFFFPAQSGAHDWTLRTISLNQRTNVVRWTYLGRPVNGSAPGTAWLDDIQFTPRPPAPPFISILRNDAPEPLLQITLEADRPTVIESSTNLVNWSAWTNIQSPTPVFRATLPTPTDDTPLFFRAKATE